MKKIIYITNIPTPYRNHRFNVLSNKLLKENIELEVLYMSQSENDRDWKINESEIEYSYKIFSKRKVGKLYGIWTHFPIALFKYLLTSRYEVAVLGGIASPAHMICAMILRKDSKKILSVESNLASMQSKSSVIKCIKSFLYNRFEHFQVTGIKAREYVEYLTKKKKNIITLPNIIDEKSFAQYSEACSAIGHMQVERSKGNQIWCIPARLIEKKGIVPFLSALEEQDKICVYIAGDGPLKADIEKIILSRRLNVNLLGNLNSEQMPSLIANSDFLVLPSKSDPYPLSVIEACFLATPIIISNRLGNFNDVLLDGKNGFSFKFGNNIDLRRTIEQTLLLTDKQIKELGRFSRYIFESKFESSKVLDKYVYEICK